jgi:5-hydroxyisourate hydrolase
MTRSPITTHVLDVVSGRPGAGIKVTLERKTNSASWQAIAEGMTDADGRIMDLMSPTEPFLVGHYRLNFDTGPYFTLRNADAFFPQVTISFVVEDATQHYHVPLLLSPFGYTTYRGS